MSARSVVTAVIAATVVIAGCTAVPASSSPQVVNKVGGASQASDLTIAPPPGADPRTIVAGFLDATATDDPHHTAARGFLTPEARTRWQDSTVTVVDDRTVSNLLTGTVTVTGRRIGTVSASGTYQPDTSGDGTGGTSISSPFAMKRVSGQWRIDSLPPGVLLTAAEFGRLYTQRQLYFYDLAEQRLVPDNRFTAIIDPGLLANWLLAQLVAGPRPELQNAVTTEFPAQPNASRVAVAVGSPSVVDVPGAGQLNAATRNHLAAQLAVTLVQVSAINELTINDTGKPVTIPETGGARFSAGVFQAAVAPPIAAPSLYYLRGGVVVDEAGRALPGPVGNGSYGLTSAAIASGGSPDLRVAGIAGGGSSAQLLIGTVNNGLRKAALARGPLSRPAWAPGLGEVWVGDGSRIFRCGGDGACTVVVPTTTTGDFTGSITALRLSPEGSRIAMVITAGDLAQVWVGSVVRSAAQVRIDGLEPVTPLKVVIKDVAWNGPLKLFVIGTNNGDTNIYEVQVDGSLWTPQTVTNLPQAPDAITVAANQVAWVSADNTVWVQRAGAWASPQGGTTTGTDPVYLE